MYFEGDRAQFLAKMREQRNIWQWLLDRLAFPWLAVTPGSEALKHGLMPLDLERFRVVLVEIRGRLLDIGCGDNLLVEAYGNGVGADIIDWGHVDVVLTGDGSLPFDDGSFDTVTIVAALNHMAHRDELIKECHRVLSPPGRLIVTMLNPPVSYISHHLRRRIDPDQIHRRPNRDEVWGMWPRDVERLLNRGGFSLQSSRGFVWDLNLINIAKRVD